MLPRWSLDDIITRYSLEPGLRDVFVEGEFDQEIISRSAKHHGKEDIVIYPSDCVEISRELLLKHRLTLGNKQRLIALSREIENAGVKANLVILVDRDIDHMVGMLESQRNLRWTRYCDIQCYLFSKRLVQEIVCEVARAKVTDFDSYFASLISVSRFIFAFRLVNHDMRLNLKIIDWSKILVAKNDSISLDENEFIKRVLNKNAKSAIADEFHNRILLWMDKLNGDFRLWVRGHDFVELMAVSIRMFKGQIAMADANVLNRILVLVADRAEELIEDIS